MSGAEDSLCRVPTSDSFTHVAQITSSWESVHVVVPAGIESMGWVCVPLPSRLKRSTAVVYCL